MEQIAAIRIVLFTEQPFVALGVTSALSATPEFDLVTCDSLQETLRYLQSMPPDIVVIHLTPRVSLSGLGEIRAAGFVSRLVLWGDAVSPEFAFQAMHLGVRAMLPDHTSVEGLLTALRNVNRGVLCFEKELLDSVLFQKRVTLTRREGQIVALVAQGLKNKAIGNALGITEGTVKVYLYKLFKKLGVNDRLDMALYGMKNLFCGLAPASHRDLNPDLQGPVGRTAAPQMPRPSAYPRIN